MGSVLISPIVRYLHLAVIRREDSLKPQNVTCEVGMSNYLGTFGLMAGGGMFT